MEILMFEEKWYSRPVFFVTDVRAAVSFYRDLLGFREVWDYRTDGRAIVAQVNRGSDCELILSEDSDRAGGSRVFVSLNADEMAVLQEETEAKDIPTTQSWWGYPVLEIRDPDGNELLFPLEDSD